METHHPLSLSEIDKHYESYQIHVEPYVEIAGVMLPLILIF